MIHEIKDARQIPDEPYRRWFTDNTFDLIVWYYPNHKIMGLQLCYRDDLEEKALTWLKDKGFCHNKVDDGEGPLGRFKMTPILVPDGTFDRDRILALFEKESKEIDPEVAMTVVHVLKQYPPSIDNES